MGLFDFIKKLRVTQASPRQDAKPLQKGTRGAIAYYDLTSWWDSIGEVDQERILSILQASSNCWQNLITSEVLESSQSALDFLSDMAGWFKKDEHRDLAYKILEQADRLAGSTEGVLSKHYYYQAKIEIYYRDRGKPEGLAGAVQACRNQIGLAGEAAKCFRRDHPGAPLPEHLGYKQLAIILDRQGRKDEALSVVRAAKQQGWGGDWDKRIERYEKSMKS